MQKTWVQSLGQKKKKKKKSLGQEDPLEKEMATHSSISPGKSHGQRSLAGYSPGGCKSQTNLLTEHTCIRDWRMGILDRRVPIFATVDQ